MRKCNIYIFKELVGKSNKYLLLFVTKELVLNEDQEIFHTLCIYFIFSRNSSEPSRNSSLKVYYSIDANF